MVRPKIEELNLLPELVVRLQECGKYYAEYLKLTEGNWISDDIQEHFTYSLWHDYDDGYIKGSFNDHDDDEIIIWDSCKVGVEKVKTETDKLKAKIVIAKLEKDEGE